MIDSIIADGAISDSHLRMLIEQITVTEKDGKLTVNFMHAAPIESTSTTMTIEIMSVVLRGRGSFLNPNALTFYCRCTRNKVDKWIFGLYN